MGMIFLPSLLHPHARLSIYLVLIIMTKKYHEDVLDLEEGLLSGSFDKLAILWDAAFGSSFLFDIRARHNS